MEVIETGNKSQLVKFLKIINKQIIQFEDVLQVSSFKF